MRVMRYRLTRIGWLGAAMFVLPVPIAAYSYHSAIQRFAERGDFARRLESIQGVLAAPDFSPMLFTALGTASLIGVVMLLIGREIITAD